MPQVYRAIRAMFPKQKWRICKDDIVYILCGPERGQTGRVLEVIKDTRVPQVVVEGKNLVSHSLALVCSCPTSQDRPECGLDACTLPVGLACSARRRCLTRRRVKILKPTSLLSRWR